MSDTLVPPDDPRENIRRQWLDHAASVFDRLFPNDPDLTPATFDALEQRTDNLARDLTCWLLQQRLNADPLAQPASDRPPACPRCQGPGRPVNAPDQPPPRRVLVTTAGDVEFRRARYRCPACRVVFFPPR